MTNTPTSSPPNFLRLLAQQRLCIPCPHQKAIAVRQMDASALIVDCNAHIEPVPGIPGRPLRPLLVPPTQLKTRAVGTLEGRAGLIHALAHIEANAINLALDVIWRFGGMPVRFYLDWLEVAREEALHFQLLAGHLKTLGFDYGDFPAHDGLWEMAEKTRSDLLARLALVPPFLMLFCVTRLVMWRLATTGIATCAQSRGWSMSAPTPPWPRDMVHHASKAPSTWKPAGLRALTKPNSQHCAKSLER